MIIDLDHPVKGPIKVIGCPLKFYTEDGALQLDVLKERFSALMAEGRSAVENQYYVVAAAQVGETMPGRLSFGRSLIADPWGTVVATAPDEETVITAELDRRRLEEVRAKLPSLASRQAAAYRWPTPTP